jgi:long-chain acyl-CoA synthetase
MLERACENAMFYAGGAVSSRTIHDSSISHGTILILLQVGYYSGDIKELTNDLKALKPTIMPAVPRLLNRVYDKIHNEISNSPIKKMLFRMALNSKEAELKHGIIRKTSMWDKLVFRKVQDAFGGRLRLMVRKFLNLRRAKGQ